MNDIPDIRIMPKKKLSKIDSHKFLDPEKCLMVRSNDRVKFKKKRRNRSERQISSYFFLFALFPYIYLFIKIQAMTAVLSKKIRTIKIILQNYHGSPL